MSAVAASSINPPAPVKFRLPKTAPPKPTKQPITTYPKNKSKMLPPSKIAQTKPTQLKRPAPPTLAEVLAPPPPLGPLIMPSTVPSGPDEKKGESKHQQPVAIAVENVNRKNRTRTKTPTELYAAAEARRQKYNRKYINHCKKYGIPYPHVGVRESDHLNECHKCQQTWPLFLYEQHYVCKHPMEDVTRAWCDLPEFERARLHAMLLKADRQWIKSMVKSRTVNSFQLFTRDIVRKQPEINAIKPFKEKAKTISKLWSEQTPETRQAYDERARKIKVDRDNLMATMPEFKKKQVQRARREYRRALRECHPPKPPNPFLMFLRESWKEEAKKPQHLSYLDFQKKQAGEWKSMPEERRKKYTDQAIVDRAAYFARRDAAQQRIRAVREQTNLAKKSMKTKVVPVGGGAGEKGHTDDEGDDEGSKKKKRKVDPKAIPKPAEQKDVLEELEQVENPALLFPRERKYYPKKKNDKDDEEEDDEDDEESEDSDEDDDEDDLEDDEEEDNDEDDE